MYRQIIFAHEPDFESLGRNGYIRTLGCSITTMGDHRPDGPTAILLEPISSKNQIGRGSIALDPDAAGEMAVTFMEIFVQGASPQVKADLLARLTAVCEGQPDPVRAVEEAERQAAHEAARQARLAVAP
jgi:hypothetical protein